MEETGAFWYKQLWKNNLAVAFTVSSTVYGDKLNTLQSIATSAAQHSMHWINLGILPRFLNNEQTDGQNRLSTCFGLMMQSDNSKECVAPFNPGDLLTLELFARRIMEVTMNFKNLKINNYDTFRN
jgi:NAD(P)H dehydrogenase (quinone)